MSHTATAERNTTTVRDGWSRDPDGVLRLPKERAFQAFMALQHSKGHVPDFALNLRCSRGMGFEEFLDANDIDFPEAS